MTRARDPVRRRRPTNAAPAAPAVAAAVLLLLALPAAGTGQEGGDGTDEPAPADAGAVQTEEEPRRDWRTVWSLPSAHSRLYLGAWSAHTFDPDFPDFFANHGLGLQHRGFFAVTFLNSFEDRAVAAGVERSWVGWEEGRFSAMLGFRAGLLYGYDEKFADVAETVPVLPIAQPLAMIRFGRFGADVSYIGRAVSVMGGLFF